MDYKLLYKVLLFFIWRFHPKAFADWKKQIEKNARVEEVSQQMINNFPTEGFIDEDL